MTDNHFRLTSNGATRDFHRHWSLNEKEQETSKTDDVCQLRPLSSLNIFELMVLGILMRGEIYQIELQHLIGCTPGQLTACLIKLSTLEKHPAYGDNEETEDGTKTGKIVLGCL